MPKKKKEFGIQTLQGSLAGKSEEYLKEIQKELVEEEHTAFKDFIKGAYRLLMEKQKAVQNLEKEVATLKIAIDNAGKGDWKEFEKLKIPARFFDEATLRKHGHTYMDGGKEIRFVDLYKETDKE